MIRGCTTHRVGAMDISACVKGTKLIMSCNILLSLSKGATRLAIRHGQPTGKSNLDGPCDLEKIRKNGACQGSELLVRAVHLQSMSLSSLFPSGMMSSTISK